MQSYTSTPTNDLLLLSNMKCQFKKLQQLNKRIANCEAQMQNIRTLPYYTLFKREAERATDLAIIQHQLNTLISKRNKLTTNT